MHESTKPEYHPPGLEFDHQQGFSFVVIEVRSTAARNPDDYIWSHQLMRSDGVVLAQRYHDSSDAARVAADYNRRAFMWHRGVAATEADLEQQRAELELERNMQWAQGVLEAELERQKQSERPDPAADLELEKSRQPEWSGIEKQLGNAIDALERHVEALHEQARSNVDRLDAIEADYSERNLSLVMARLERLELNSR